MRMFIPVGLPETNCKRMKRLVILLPVFFFTLWVKAADESLTQQAENFYREGKYSEAAECYRKILAEKEESAALYYNLGNCYYKLNDNTRAILNYERSLLLNSGDNDARYNLQLAQSRVVDKIEVLPELFLIRWYKGLIASFSADQWAYISVTLFILFLGMVAVFFYSTTVWAKKTGFFVGIVILFFTCSAVYFAVKQHNRIMQRDHAIVMTPSVTVKGAPDNSGTDLFVVHEGLKVKVIGSLGDWSNIQLEDGNEGWVAKSDIEKI